MRARPFVALFGLTLGLGGAPASAQDLDAGKSPAQLFSSNCTACHQSAHGLVKSGGAGLSSFLRQHYTTSSASANALASYLATLGPDPREAERKRREAEAAQRRDKEARERRETQQRREAERRNERQGAQAARVNPPARSSETRGRDELPIGLTGWPRASDAEHRGPAVVSSDPDPVTVASEPVVVPPPHEAPFPYRPPFPPLPPVSAAAAQNARPSQAAAASVPQPRPAAAATESRVPAASAIPARPPAADPADLDVARFAESAAQALVVPATPAPAQVMTEPASTPQKPAVDAPAVVAIPENVAPRVRSEPTAKDAKGEGIAPGTATGNAPVAKKDTSESRIEAAPVPEKSEPAKQTQAPAVEMQSPTVHPGGSVNAELPVQISPAGAAQSVVIPPASEVQVQAAVAPPPSSSTLEAKSEAPGTPRPEVAAVEQPATPRETEIRAPALAAVQPDQTRAAAPPAGPAAESPAAPESQAEAVPSAQTVFSSPLP